MTSMVQFIEIIPWLLTIFTFSLIFRENPAFRIAEHVALGAVAGQVLLTGTQFITDSAIMPVLVGNLTMIIPLLIGIASFGVFTRGYGWVTRYPAVIMAGVGLGLAVRGFLRANLTSQIAATITPPPTMDLVSALHYFLGIIVVITSLSYFIFTREHVGVLGHSARLGRSFILVMLGVGYAGRLLSGASLLISSLANVVAFARSVLGV